MSEAKELKDYTSEELSAEMERRDEEAAIIALQDLFDLLKDQFVFCEETASTLEYAASNVKSEEFKSMVEAIIEFHSPPVAKYQLENLIGIIQDLSSTHTQLTELSQKFDTLRIELGSFLPGQKIDVEEQDS